MFCLTGLLHSISLHAMWLPSGLLMLERNPIVYNVSLTSFWQCCHRRNSTDLRQQQRRGTDRRADDQWLFSAVYEPAEGRSLVPASETLSTSWFSKTSPSLNAMSAVGAQVTTAYFAEALESARSLMFSFGHCILDRDHIAERAIELADGMLMVKDIFKLRLKASHVTLIACDSASQDVYLGDEPLRVVTALLCAGAGSVLGDNLANSVPNRPGFRRGDHGFCSRTILGQSM